MIGIDISISPPNLFLSTQIWFNEWGVGDGASGGITLLGFGVTKGGLFIKPHGGGQCLFIYVK